MKLNLEQLQQITTGAVNIKKENEMFSFSRFTTEQEKLYEITNQNFYNKAQSTAGVKISFKTDSKNLFIKLRTFGAASRTYFSVDVFVDKYSIGYIDNFSDLKLDPNYTQQEFLLGTFSKNFKLGDGEKTVCIHLPWSVKAMIEEISVDDNSFVEGIKPKKKLIAYGDSITHGYDSLRPSNRYIAKLADRLGAEEFNKGIGGERFFPELAKLKDPFVPDYITVAYGTNDWSGTDKEAFKCKCKGFFTNLAENYPDSKIFAITPIWRKDHNEDTEFGAFHTVEKYIRESVEPIKNITVVSGFDLVPKDESYFADSWLHPNDKGFKHFEENLYDIIKKYI